MLDNTKTITAVTYNGNEWPVGGGGGETCTLTITGGDLLKYVDGDGIFRNASYPSGTYTVAKNSIFYIVHMAFTITHTGNITQLNEGVIVETGYNKEFVSFFIDGDGSVTLSIK